MANNNHQIDPKRWKEAGKTVKRSANETVNALDAEMTAALGDGWRTDDRRKRLYREIVQQVTPIWEEEAVTPRTTAVYLEAAWEHLLYEVPFELGLMKPSTREKVERILEEEEQEAGKPSVLPIELRFQRALTKLKERQKRGHRPPLRKKPNEGDDAFQGRVRKHTQEIVTVAGDDLGPSQKAGCEIIAADPENTDGDQAITLLANMLVAFVEDHALVLSQAHRDAIMELVRKLTTPAANGRTKGKKTKVA